VIVVADTSVILNLALVGHESLLDALFHEVVVPPAVQAEFVRLAESSGRFAGLALPQWIRVQLPETIPATIAGDADLDPGESQALALALEIRADGVLIDEAHGRSIAIEFGLTPIGVVGILIRAKRNGLLPAVGPVIRDLLAKARFRASDDLIREALRLSGE
jgi:predicted nucleic acid-binding protein